MASQGPFSPNTFSDDSGVGSVAWVGVPGLTSDNLYATATVGTSTPSHYGKATNPAFPSGFSIPAGSTINGILVEVESGVSSQSQGKETVDNAVRIVKGGVIGSTDKSSATIWTTTDAYISHGGPTDLWGETWTAADINASGFGVAISVKSNAGSNRDARIDHIRITVYYTESTEITKTHGADLVARATTDKTHGADLIVRGTFEKAHGADLIARATGEISHGADLIVAPPQVTLTHGADLIVRGTFTLEHGADLHVVARDELTHGADLVALKIATLEHGADLVALLESDAGHGADLIAVDRQTPTHGADLVALLESTPQHSADLIARATGEKTHGADLRAVYVRGRSHGADLRVVGEPEGYAILRHEFIAADGTKLRLPIIEMPGQELVDEFRAHGEAPGGFMGATAEISEAIVDANPDVFVWGTEWRVWNDDGPSRLVWAGHLSDPQPIAGSVLLHGIGTGERADKAFEHILGQTRDELRWGAADSEPHNYDVDEQIRLSINGRRARFSVRRKEQFLRANGKAVLDGGVSKGDTSITLSVNGGGLVDGEKIHIGGETRTVDASYTPGSTTVPLTQALSYDHDNGEKVWWHASGNPSQWDTGMVFWAPEVGLSRIYFEIDKQRSTSTYELQILKGTGPDGALTLVKTLSLAAGEDTIIDELISGNPDLLVIRMRRTSHTERARAFRCVLKDVRVNGFSTADNLQTSDIVEYIAGRVDAPLLTPPSMDGIQVTTTNGFPLDAEDASAAQILDELAMLDDFFWAREHNGSVPEWVYQSWAHRTYNLTDVHAPVELIPLERFNKARVPHRYPGGVKAHVTMTADPDPLPAGFDNTIQIDLDDPLPGEDIAEAFGQNIINYLSLKRFGGQAQFSYLEDDAGVRLQATRIRAGDTLRLTNYGDLELRVRGVLYENSTVTVTFAESHPLLDRILARRTLMLARGRSNADATLDGFDLEQPAIPEDVQMAFFEADRRGGKRRWNGRLKWSEVTEDIEGNATAIRKYITQWRAVHPVTGVPIPESQGGGIIERTVTKKQLDDPEIDELPTHRLLRNLEQPHYWKWQGRVAAADSDGPGEFSAWTTAAKPAAFGPPDPTSVGLDVDQHWAKGGWDGDDPDETDADGNPSLDRRVKGYKYRLKKNGTVVFPANPNRWKFTKSDAVRIRVNKPGSATYQLDVKAVDYYGNESNVVSQTNVRGVPPDPTSAPTITIDKGGKKKRRITITGTYAGSHADDDIRNIIIRAVIGSKTERPRVQIEDDGTFSHVIPGQDAGDSYDISYRVVDDDGKRSGFSPVASGVLTDVTPPAPTQPQVVSKLKKVVVKGYQTAGDKAEVDEYLIEISTYSGTNAALFAASLVDFEYRKAGKAEFDREKTDPAVYARVSSFGPTGNQSAYIYSVGGSSPSGADTAFMDGTYWTSSGSIYFRADSDTTATYAASKAGALVGQIAFGYQILSDEHSLLLQPSMDAGDNRATIVLYGGPNSDDDRIEITASEIIQTNVGRGRGGGQIPGSKATVNDTWGFFCGWFGCTKLDHAPSFVSLSNPDHNGQKNITQSNFTDRGFILKADVNASGTFMRLLADYLSN